MPSPSNNNNLGKFSLVIFQCIHTYTQTEKQLAKQLNSKIDKTVYNNGILSWLYKEHWLGLRKKSSYSQINLNNLSVSQFSQK